MTILERNGYRVLDRVGGGAYGTVFRVADAAGNVFAAKVLHAELAADATLYGGFVREGQLLRALCARPGEASNIVRCHRVLADNDEVAFVMDYVAGGDLAAVVEACGSLAPAVAFELAARICDGLYHLHLEGLAHRDIKPSNILLGPPPPGDRVPTPLIVDLGIASVVRHYGTAGRGTSRTGDGTFAGTVSYMAPESWGGIADGTSSDARIGDLYSVGCVLYELLTGYPPFPLGTPNAIIDGHRRLEPVPIPGLPEPAWVVVRNLLHKAPRPPRPTQANAAARALRDAATGLAGLAPLGRWRPAPDAGPAADAVGMSGEAPVAVRRRARWPWAVAGAAAVVVAAVVTALVVRSPSADAHRANGTPPATTVAGGEAGKGATGPSPTTPAPARSTTPAGVAVTVETSAPLGAGPDAATSTVAPTVSTIALPLPATTVTGVPDPAATTNLPAPPVSVAATGPPAPTPTILTTAATVAPATVAPATAPPATVAPTAATAPPAVAPAAMAAPGVAAGDRSVTLSYTAPSAGTQPITSYEALGSDGTVRTVDGAGVVSGLTNGTSYTFKIHACSAAGCGQWSAPGPAVIPAGVPGGASGLSVAGVTTSSLTITWAAADGNGRAVSGYQVAVNGATSDVGNVLSWTATGLSASTTYTFAVRAVNAVGPGGWSANLSGRTSDPPPPQTWAETVGGNANTWSDYTSAGGTHGPTIAAYTTVQIACRLTGFRVSNGNTWWYRIASSPWNNAFYVSADAFYNNGQTSGSLSGTPWVDPAVAMC